MTTDHLDLGSLPEGQRFDAWRVLTDPFFEVRLPEDATKPFGGSVTALKLNETLLIHSRVSGQHYHRSAARARADEWDQIAVQLYRSGSFCGDYDGHDIRAGPGDLNVIDFTRPYAKRSSDEADINLIVPRAIVLRYCPDLRHGGVLRGRTALGGLAATHLDLMMQAGPAMTGAEADSAVGAFLLVLSGSGLRRATPGERASIRASARAVAVRFVAKALLHPRLSPDAIAKACGLSRASLFRAFEADGGVRRYIVNQRLAAALAELKARPLEPVQDIADRCGFADPAQFSRLFRRAFGCSPSDARGEGAVNGGATQVADPQAWLSALRALQESDAA